MDIKELKSKPCCINAIIDKEYSSVLETVYTRHWFSYLRPVQSPPSNRDNCEGPAVDQPHAESQSYQILLERRWWMIQRWVKEVIFLPFYFLSIPKAPESQHFLNITWWWIQAALGRKRFCNWTQTLNLFFSAWSSTAPQSPDTSLVISRWTLSNWGL